MTTKTTPVRVQKAATDIGLNVATWRKMQT